MAERRCVVLGDVVDSRTVEDRERTRERLERAVDAATDAAGGDVVAPFVVLRGVDQVGGVLVDPASAVPALRALGLVFTAKSIVRWQDVGSGNTTYYLTGSHRLHVLAARRRGDRRRVRRPALTLSASIQGSKTRAQASAVTP